MVPIPILLLPAPVVQPEHSSHTGTDPSLAGGHGVLYKHVPLTGLLSLF